MRPFDISAVVGQLLRLQRAMGVSEPVELPPEELTTDGILVSLFEVRPDVSGVLRYKGEAVVLYIHEQNSLSDWATSTPYKFHILDCATLKGMRTQGHGQRYVVTNRDDGTFPVRTSTGRVRLMNMSLCGNCDNAVTSSREDFFPRSRYPYFDIRAFFQTFKNVQSWPPRITPFADPSPAPPVAQSPTPAAPQSTRAASPTPPAPSVPVAPPVETPDPPTPKWADPIHVWPGWSLQVPDLSMRAALVYIERYGTLSEEDLIRMVGDARRARRFAHSYEEWLKIAPFKVSISSTNGAKTYRKRPS
jgi:hypothetical protein